MKKLTNTPDEQGKFGQYGGSFLSPELQREIDKVNDCYQRIKNDAEFIAELKYIRKYYQGRPTPITFARNLSAKYGGAAIYLKREDLNHTGAHKLNHCMGEALLAKKMGKKKLIAETGAGQHGVALATAAAYFGMECEIHMGEVDVKKESPNVARMKVLGAKIVVVHEGAKTLKEAVDSAFAAYVKEADTALYAIGSVVGPHPFPVMVRDFQSIVGREAREQFMEISDGRLPDHVVACVGGGSNAMGIFHGFLGDENVQLYGVEPLGRLKTADKNIVGEHAASVAFGKKGILHGFESLLLTDGNGDPAPVYSIASGLDYPSVGPEHALLHEIGRVNYIGANDDEAVAAFYELSKLEGIIPALESAHAVAAATRMAANLPGQTILVNLSGRGDKDMDFVMSLK
ncbi:tryptophan synthase subunit beta [Candidatus Saccharibacteria bacterium]|nr:tryptophan synthase subunit beta [Candidatus Saccharibacteria bacterium]MCL1963029.1 tryptophan synthase subunit beta [Candidatus Saccharibacteria bacterium]